jgi:hypothetical protein
VEQLRHFFLACFYIPKVAGKSMPERKKRSQRKSEKRLERQKQKNERRRIQEERDNRISAFDQAWEDLAVAGYCGARSSSFAYSHIQHEWEKLLDIRRAPTFMDPRTFIWERLAPRYPEFEKLVDEIDAFLKEKELRLHAMVRLVDASTGKTEIVIVEDVFDIIIDGTVEKMDELHGQNA